MEPRIKVPFARLAQGLEHQSYELRVVGSIPTLSIGCEHLKVYNPVRDSIENIFKVI
jgi:hypothetical protein